MSRKIPSLEALRTLCAKKPRSCFLLLRGGLSSHKLVSFNPKTGRFRVENGIDGSIQHLTMRQLDDRTLTNIGLAIHRGAFYIEE